MKRRVLFAAACAALSVAATTAAASEQTDRLAQCLVDNATPRDQAALVKWMFSGMSMNPALKSMAALSPEQRDEINRNLAALFERLILKDCRAEMVVALKTDGNAAIQSAFAVMGQRAAQQLMSDPASSAELDKMSGYLDQAKWAELMKEIGTPGGKGAEKP